MGASIAQHTMETVSSTTGPQSATCSGTILLRTAKIGANAGGQFWGCANYPRCRSVVSVGG
jgi:ssDNA-binding Zn-finger/Zn-ribbon topoisomerase 1